MQVPFCVVMQPHDLPLLSTRDPSLALNELLVISIWQSTHTHVYDENDDTTLMGRESYRQVLMMLRQARMYVQEAAATVRANP